MAHVATLCSTRRDGMHDSPPHGSYLFNAHRRLRLPQTMPPLHFNFCRQQLSELMQGTDISDEMAKLANSSPALLTSYALELQQEPNIIGISAVLRIDDYKTMRKVSRQSMLSLPLAVNSPVAMPLAWTRYCSHAHLKCFAAGWIAFRSLFRFPSQSF